MISGFFEGLPVSTVECIVGVCTAAEFKLENLNHLLEMYHRNPLNEYGYMMVFAVTALYNLWFFPCLVNF